MKQIKDITGFEKKIKTTIFKLILKSQISKIGLCNLKKSRCSA